MKFLIIGHGRHGKDTVADYMCDKFKLTASSSSLFAAEKVVYPDMSEDYKNADECFEDRHNHRKRWFDLISAYNTPDGTRLAREMMETHDIYVGMRNKRELDACREQKMFDVVVWVDASKRHPPESVDSCTVTAQDADVVIDNNGSLQELFKNVDNALFLQKK
jgi:hypothetical protein